MNGIELCWRRNFCAGTQDGVTKVEHLRPVDRRISRNKNQHVSGSNDFLLVSCALLFRRAQAHDLVRGHERALDLFHMGGDVVEDRRHARPGEVERRLSNSLCPCHIAEEFCGVVLVGGKRDADLAIADDALIAPVFVHDLADVLCDEVGLKAR